MFGLVHLVFVEGLRAQQHLLVEAGGMEQMELALLPESDADVAGVESVRIGQHRHNVAILDDSQSCVLFPIHVLLGNVSELTTVGGLLVLLDGCYELRMVLQLFVEGRVG